MKAGDQIIYQEPESEDWNKVTLTSRGYRSTSLNKNYWNAKTVGENSSDIGVNLDKVDWLKQDTQNPNGLQLGEEVEASIAFAETISEEIFVLYTETCKSSNFQIAKENEIKTWKRFDVFTEVDRRDFLTLRSYHASGLKLRNQDLIRRLYTNLVSVYVALKKRTRRTVNHQLLVRTF